MIKFFTIFIINFLDKYVHQKRIKTMLSKIKSEIKMVLDVGCHEGEYSILFKSVFKNCQIHAFEPNISLKSKIEKKNDLKKNFKINYFAVSDIDGDLKMIIDKEVSKISTASTINYDSKTFKMKELLYSSNKNKDINNISIIKSTKIDTYLENNNINADFVKIDVEGFELEVLKGFKNKIIKTKYIMIEHHKDNLYINKNNDKISEFLEQNNFAIVFSLKFPLMNWEDRLYINKKL